MPFFNDASSEGLHMVYGRILFQPRQWLRVCIILIYNGLEFNLLKEVGEVEGIIKMLAVVTHYENKIYMDALLTCTVHWKGSRHVEVQLLAYRRQESISAACCHMKTFSKPAFLCGHFDFPHKHKRKNRSLTAPLQKLSKDIFHNSVRQIRIRCTCTSISWLR